MRKYLLIVILLSIFLVGCKKTVSFDIDVNAIDDLDALQQTITQVADALHAGTMPKDQAQLLLAQLEQKYIDLTDTPQNTIDTQFAEIHQSLDEQYLSYSLPLWAKRLGMTLPHGMQLNTTLSKHISRDDGYESTTLVYRGSYAIAMQQAEIIAKRANLFVSKDFQQAQTIAQSGSVKYISGLDVDSLAKGIVYVNHELLDTDVENLLSVSVDQDGTLIIETTKYK